MKNASIEQQLQAGLKSHHQGNWADAESRYREALALQPGNGMAWHLLGALCLNLGRHTEAVSAIERALQLAPSAPSWLNYARALFDLEQHQAALQASLQAATLQPNWADAHHYAGVLWLTLGFPAEALQAFQSALRCNPNQIEALQGMLLPMQYLHEISPEQVAQAHQAWGEQFQSIRPRHPSRARTGHPRRIGWVSGDLCTHPVGNQLRGVLPALRALGYEFTLYPTRAMPADDPITQALRELGAWVPLHGLSDATAADRIQADSIDILVDLSGHTGHSRLPLFAMRPAPLQLTWLGYTTTTGMSCFDALLLDRCSRPENGPEWFSEPVVATNSPRLLWVPPLQDQPLQGLRHAGPPVFGCFNNVAKLRPPVIALWAELLKSVPESTLFLKGRQFDHAMVREAALQGFAAHGIETGRLRIEGFSAREAGYYQAYADVDVALDPFPFTGGATTLDALWMGVPVVSMVGQTLVSRQGACLLQAVGHPEWLAADREDYLAIAKSLLTCRPSRQELRTAVMTSPLADTAACARELAAVVEQLWAQPCRSTELPSVRR